MLRARIEEFCRMCLADKFTLQLPAHCKQELLQINVEFTKGGFELEFERLCKSVLFECAAANLRGRVVALLWYTKVLRQRYRNCCSDDIFVSIITNVLERINFNPDDLKSNPCTIL